MVPRGFTNIRYAGLLSPGSRAKLDRALTVDGKPTRNWAEVAAKLGIRPSWRGERSTTFRAGLVVPTGALVELLNLPDTADERMIRGAPDRLQTWVCFCSLYGDCWENRSNDYESQRVKACIDDPTRRFVE